LRVRLPDSLRASRPCACITIVALLLLMLLLVVVLLLAPCKL
jgi:hypothetical protein